MVAADLGVTALALISAQSLGVLERRVLLGQGLDTRRGQSPVSYLADLSSSIPTFVERRSHRDS
jgi:hypothetical protein